jgi:hypothetical protein
VSAYGIAPFAFAADAAGQRLDAAARVVTVELLDKLDASVRSAVLTCTLTKAQEANAPRDGKNARKSSRIMA